ncbi:hypothetical protein PIB30_004831 [Stylosanthes scabra]|uniref:Uncharacterized protein n=1 Tax=Stylosanthes scabra TaxID=79078 RepID=A0ABU6U2L1_9FABA|nr:hypothetical protein [Stylosanthes scabra]
MAPTSSEPNTRYGPAEGLTDHPTYAHQRICPKMSDAPGRSRVHSSSEVVVSVEGKVVATDIASTEVEWVTRPKPKLPDPNSLAVVRIKETSCKEEGRTEAVTGGHSGAADSFVAEGKRGTLMAHVDGDVTVTDGSLRARLLRRSVLLTSPPLLAAVFPWDRGGRETTGGLFYGAAPASSARQREYAAITMTGGKTHETTNGEGWVSAEVSVAEKEEAAASSVSRVNGGGRAPGMAMVGVTILRPVATGPAPTAAMDAVAWAVGTSTSSIASVGGRFLQDVPSNLLRILGWGRDMVIRVGTANFIHYGGGSKTKEEEVAAWHPFSMAMGHPKFSFCSITFWDPEDKVGLKGGRLLRWALVGPLAKPVRIT